MMGRETLAVKLKDSSPQDTTSTNVGQKTCVCVCVTTRCYTLGTGHLRRYKRPVVYMNWVKKDQIRPKSTFISKMDQSSKYDSCTYIYTPFEMRWVSKWRQYFRFYVNYPFKGPSWDSLHGLRLFDSHTMIPDHLSGLAHMPTSQRKSDPTSH